METQTQNTNTPEDKGQKEVDSVLVVKAVTDLIDNGHVYVERNGKVVVTPKLQDYKMEIVIDREEKVVSVYLGSVRGYLRIVGEEFDKIDTYLEQYMEQYNKRLASRLLKIARVSNITHGAIDSLTSKVDEIDEIKKEIAEDDKKLLSGNRKQALGINSDKVK